MFCKPWRHIPIYSVSKHYWSNRKQFLQVKRKCQQQLMLLCCNAKSRDDACHSKRLPFPRLNAWWIRKHTVINVVVFFFLTKRNFGPVYKWQHLVKMFYHLPRILTALLCVAWLTLSISHHVPWSDHDDVAFFWLTSLMTLNQYKNRNLRHNCWFEEWNNG